MRKAQDDARDAALSLVAAPLTAIPSALIAIASLTPIADVVRRFFETGPWGVAFDRLTWLPWLHIVAEPRCLFVDRSTGASELLPLSRLPACPSGSKRVVMISDTHGKHRLLRLPPGDVLVHTGDVLSRNACVMLNNSRSHRAGRAALRDFNDWLALTPCAAKIVCAGNHDATLEALGAAHAQALLSNATYLQDSGAVTEGLCFYGTPWSRRGHSPNAAFQSHEPPARPAAALGRVDVLMSHGFDVGLVSDVEPHLYVSGHSHETHGVLQTWRGGVAVNAAICDHVYRAIHAPVVCDIEPQRRF